MPCRNANTFHIEARYGAVRPAVTRMRSVNARHWRVNCTAARRIPAPLLFSVSEVCTASWATTRLPTGVLSYLGTNYATLLAVSCHNSDKIMKTLHLSPKITSAF